MAAKTLAKVILLTRDETDLIEDFLAYWGGLFDAKNVVVVDNGSTCPKVLEAYRKHAAEGGVVIYDPRPFNRANDFMTEHMRRIADSGSCEWILPIETDEFVFCHPFLNRSDRPSIHEIREAIHNHLSYDIPPFIGVLRYGYFWGSSVDPADDDYVRGSYERPAVDMTRFHDQGWDKLIVRSRAFARMDQWCHHASCKPGFVKGGTNHLGLLHFHDAGKKRAVERAIPVVEGYGYVTVKNRTLSEQLRDAERLQGLSVSCGHKLEYLDSHLKRLATLKAFRKHLGRLPDTYGVEPPTVEGSSSAERSSTGIEGPTSWDDYLYHETRMDHAFVVDHLLCLRDIRDIREPQE